MLIFSIFKYGVVTLTSAIILGFIYLFIKLVVRPYLKLQFYKRQGIPIFFSPPFGHRARTTKYEKEHGDALSYFKKLAEKDTNIRADATHFADRAHIFLFDTKLIKEYYMKPIDYYEKVQPKILVQIFGKGLLFSEGKRWKAHRRTLSSVFHFEFLKENIPLVVNTAREFISNLKNSSMKEIDVLNEMQKITGEVVGRTFFGESLNSYSIKGMPMTTYLADVLARAGFVGKSKLWILFFLGGINLELIPSHHEYMNEVRAFRKFCLKIIQDRKSLNTKGFDMLGLLFETQKAAKEEDRFTDDDLVDEFMTFFIAGMDTTGQTVTMMLYLLYKHPEVMEKVKKEVREVYDKNTIVTIEELNQMEYMHAVIKEALRMYTPAPSIIPRVAKMDHEIGDIKLKKGDSVSIGFMYNSSNQKNFEDPDRFMPERWLNKKGDVDSFSFTPFSAGQRNCIGQHLALIEAKIIVAEFLKTFEYKVVPENFELVMGQNFLYKPKKIITFDLFEAK